MDDTSQQKAVAQPKTIKKDSNILMIIIIVLLSLILGIIIGLLIPFNEESNIEISSTKQTESQPTTAPTVEPTIALDKKCSSNSFGTTFSIPEDWTCDVDDIEGAEPQSVINLEGDGITIQVSNLGRGGPCSAMHADNVSDCIMSEFYKDQYFDLTLYSQDGANLEVFGTFDAYFSWTSVTWDDMNNKDLTDDQEKTIEAIFDSVEVS